MSFAYYRSLTVDHTQCGGSDSSSFPVLVFFSDLSLATVANGGHVQKSDGSDILFFADSTGVRQLPSEMESGTYNPATGTGWAWVQLNVTHSTNAVFYVLYGNSSPPARTSNPWDANFGFVWHLPNGTTLTANDSTSNNINGTISTPVAASGQVDGGASFNGTSDIISASGSTVYATTAGAFSISAWVKLNGFTHSVYPKVVVLKSNGGDGGGWELTISNDSAGGYLGVNMGSVSSFSRLKTGVAFTTGSWQHVAVTYNGTGALTPANFILYVNGVSQTLVASNSFSALANATAVGGPTSGGSSNHWDGVLDEIEVSSSLRSADWILTEYNNQNAPGNIGSPGFLTWGAEQLSLVVEDKITPGSITSRIDSGDVHFGGM